MDECFSQYQFEWIFIISWTCSENCYLAARNRGIIKKQGNINLSIHHFLNRTVIQRSGISLLPFLTFKFNFLPGTNVVPLACWCGEGVAETDGGLAKMPRWTGLWSSDSGCISFPPLLTFNFNFLPGTNVVPFACWYRNGFAETDGGLAKKPRWTGLWFSDSGCISVPPLLTFKFDFLSDTNVVPSACWYSGDVSETDGERAGIRKLNFLSEVSYSVFSGDDLGTERSRWGLFRWRSKSSLVILCLVIILTVKSFKSKILHHFNRKKKQSKKKSRKQSRCLPKIW